MFWKKFKIQTTLWSIPTAFLLSYYPIAGFSQDKPVLKKIDPSELPVKFIKATDVDDQSLVINKKKRITLLLGTSEDSQEPARLAGQTIYPFQGRKDFQLVVLVDLRDSMAGWAPSVAMQLTRRNLDDEAHNLRPYFVKNGNSDNPRKSMHVITDFDGKICQEIGWTKSTEFLRAVIYDENGREIQRWDNLKDMSVLRSTLQKALDNLQQARNSHPVQTQESVKAKN